MSKRQAAEEIRRKFLTDYKYIHHVKERISFFESLQQIAMDNDLTSDELCFKGFIDLLRKEHRSAKEYFEKALTLDSKHLLSLHGLGWRFFLLDSYRKAIDYLEKVIELDKNFPYAQAGMGICYTRIKVYDAAKAHFNLAIGIDAEYSMPWSGLGFVFFKQKEYEKANECYDNAIKIDKNYPHAYANLGLLRIDTGDYVGARDAFYRAIHLYEKYEDIYSFSKTRHYIDDVVNLLQADEELDKDTDDPAARVLKVTKESGIEEKAFKNTENFLGFIEEEPLDYETDEKYAEVLRRWNSYTPIIADQYHVSKGGGYFLKANGKGLVIDPGFNFIENFKGSNHYFYEIDAVLISHAHNDHTADLESILTLLNRYNRAIIGDPEWPRQGTIRDLIAQRVGISIDEVNEREIQEEFLRSGRRKTIDLYMTKSTYKKYSGMFDLFTRNDYFIHIIERGDKRDICGVPVEVVYAKHDDIISDRDSVGFCFDVNNSVVIYTGDTAWDSEVEKEYRNIREKYKDKSFRLLIAHLGGFKVYERNYTIAGERDKSFYRNHLGRLGLAKINEVFEPDVCFISEFGEELKGHRVDIARIYSEAFDNRIVFLPADIGLKLELSQKKIEAITEIDEAKKDYSEEYIPCDKVKCNTLLKDYSLFYYHNDLEASLIKLVQILGEKFEASIM